MTSMTITLNGQHLQIAPRSTLADAIAATGTAPQAVATAVNGDFVARDARAQHTLREGDAVFTFQPITGG